MRKHLLTGLIFVSLFSWVVVLFFFFDGSYSTSFNFLKSPSLEERLDVYEGQLTEELKHNNLLFARIKMAIETEITEKEAELEAELRRTAEQIKVFNKTTEYEIERIKAVREKYDSSIAVLVFACNRVTVVRCIDQLLKYRPSPELFPIIVTQDCQHEATAIAIRNYGDQIFHIQQPDQSEILIPPKEKKFKGYFKIARHYGWALNQTFFNFNFDNAIIIEDDLDVSPDIFEYFLGLLPILKADPTLWCVSAWNDNGKVGLIKSDAPHILHRTDFFPGLGWMLTKNMWNELAPKWPASYWDDWIRQPEQRKGRACIRPEVSRTRTFGKIGVSNGLFFEKYLKYIYLNDKFVPFTQLNLTYLLKDNYDVEFVKRVYESTIVSYLELKSNTITNEGSLRIPYYTKDMYKKTAKMLGLMDDFRSGVPRTGYRGVVSFFYNNHRVYLAPHANWKGYDITWS